MKLSSKVVLCFFVLTIFFFINNLALAEENYILEIDDPLSDDFGPGNYEYPTDDAFNEEGLFDIKSFSIKTVGEKYRLSFAFSKLNDPWGSKFGFSLPLIELYIGKKEEGITDLYREGANVRLDPDYPWNIMLKISGWWVRAYRPEDINQKEDAWDTENNPADLEDVEVDVKNNRINVFVNQEVIGDLKDAHIYLLVGSYDPFGPDNYRTIKNKYSSWYFTDINNKNLEYAPRVIDIILPEGLDQAEVLADYTDDYPIIEPIKIESKSDKVLYLPYAFFLVFLLALGLFVMNKKSPVSNNN